MARNKPIGTGDPSGAVVLFAKCPIAGSSKTRLAPLFGEEGAASLAQAMLSDILVSLSECVSLFSCMHIQFAKDRLVAACKGNTNTYCTSISPRMLE